MFIYESDETHSVGDKPNHYRRRTVKLRDHKGTKTEAYYKGSKLKVKHSEPLTAAEVKNIRERKFTPGLFDVCTTHCQMKTAKKRRGRRGSR
jgi:hypothetical protein